MPVPKPPTRSPLPGPASPVGAAPFASPAALNYSPPGASPAPPAAPAAPVSPAAPPWPGPYLPPNPGTGTPFPGPAPSPFVAGSAGASPAAPQHSHFGNTVELAERLADQLAQRLGLAPLSRRLNRHQVPTAAAGTGSLRLPGGRRFWWAYALALLLALNLGTIVGAVGALREGWANQIATWQYGDPRTTHLTATFGFTEETSVNPTLITAVNDAGTAHIFVLPGGQAAKAFVLVRVVAEDPDGRLPLHLAAVDADRDGYLDLLVNAGENPATYVWLFDSGKQILREPTAAEQLRLLLPERTR